MSRTPEVEAAIIRAYNNDGATATWNARTLAAEVERLGRLLARLGTAEARLKRLESAQGDWVPGLKCAKCYGTGEGEDVRTCSACGGTGDVWMTWQQRAETAEAELKRWRMLHAWGGEPEIVEEFIRGQQTRIHHTQGIEDALAQAEARVKELEAALLETDSDDSRLLSEMALGLCHAIERSPASELLTKCSVLASQLRTGLEDYETTRQLTEHEREMIRDGWEKFSAALADTKAPPYTADQAMRESADHSFEKWQRETKGTT